MALALACEPAAECCSNLMGLFVIAVTPFAGGGPDYLQLIGSRRLSTEYGQWIDEVNGRAARPFRIDYQFDADGHPEQYYCNGDHWNFVRYGIPSVFVTTGAHADYHRVSDEVDKIDFEKLTRVTQFVADMALDVANRPARPRIDKPKPDPRARCVQ
jgi:hypothetical protein